MNKSGIASKKRLVTGACVVDEGYTGEIFVNLHNIGEHPQFIESGDKIAQGVFVRIEKPILLEVLVSENQPALFSQQYVKNKDGTSTPKSLEYMK